MSQSSYFFCPTKSTTHHADNMMPVLIVPELNFCMDDSISDDRESPCFP